MGMNNQPPYGQPPAYGYGYPPPPPQKQGLRWWQWGLMAIGAVVVACCGLGFVAAALGRHGSLYFSAVHGPAYVGDTITVSDISCTLVSAKIIQGDEFNQPKSGNVFVLVHVKLVNNSSSEFSYYLIDFHGKSGSGNITDAEYIPPSTYTANHYLDSAKLAAGGSVEGDIIVQVPKGDHNAELTWSPGFFTNSTDNAWNLGL
jgi:hypothetical protein